MARNFETVFRIAGQIASSFPNSIRSASSALTDLSERVDQTRDRLSGLSDLLKNGLVFSGAIIAGAGVAVKAFAEAESAATDLKSAFMTKDGSLQKGFAEVNKLANELGATLPGSTADFTKMMLVLKNEGISAEQILGGMGEAAAKLAVVMKMEFPDAASFVAQLSDATKVASTDMLDFMDQVQKMYHVGLASDYMLQGFGKMSAGMKTARLEGLKGVKAMGPLLAMLGNAGMPDGGSAGGAISAIMSSAVQNLDGAASKFKKEFNKNPIKLDFTDGKGEFGGIEKMYKELDKLKALNTQERNFYLGQVFGNSQENIQALNIIIDKGQDGYNDMVAKMESQASLQQRVNVQLGTLANLWDAAKGAFDAILIAVGEALAPQLKELVTWLSEVQDKIIKWKEANSELFSTLVKVAVGIGLAVGGLSILALGFIAILGPISMAIGIMGRIVGVVGKLFSALRYLSTAIPWIITIAKWMASGLWLKAIALIKMLGTTFMWLGRIFLMNPIGLAITAIIVAIGLLYYNWDTVSKFLVTSWEWIKSEWSSSMAAITGLVSSVWTSIKAFFTSGIANITATIVNFSPVGLFYQAFAAVMSYFGIDLPAKFTDFGKMMIQGLINGIGSMIGAVVDKAKAIAGAVTGAVKGAFQINSPSRLFEQFGVYNMQGLANGMDSSVGLPQRAASSAAYGSIPSMPSSGSSLAPAGGGGSVLQLTQYITVGSGDAAEQAKTGAASGAQDMLAALKEMKAKEARLSF